MSAIRIQLIDVSKENIGEYKSFEKQYTVDLCQYLSRIYPDEKNIVKWCYIKVNNHNIGSIWLEKFDIDTVKLGVFIVDEQNRHNGYGIFAIREMIKFAELNNYKSLILNVRESNLIAHDTYKKLGFVDVNHFVKDNGVPVISMILKI